MPNIMQKLQQEFENIIDFYSANEENTNEPLYIKDMCDRIAEDIFSIRFSNQIAEMFCLYIEKEHPDFQVIKENYLVSYWRLEKKPNKKLNTYKVEFTETVKNIVYVNAENENKAREMILCGDFEYGDETETSICNEFNAITYVEKID